MEIRKIAGISPDDRAAVERIFAEIKPRPVACCNWPGEFPYAPEVSFRMFHTGDWLMLRFDVAENYTAALVTEDNGQRRWPSIVRQASLLTQQLSITISAVSNKRRPLG